MFLQIIAMVLPPVLAMGIYDHLHHAKLKTRQLIVSYAIFAILINICVYLIYIALLGMDSFQFDAIGFLRYTSLAVVMSVVFPLVVNAVNASFSVKVKRNGFRKK